MFSFKHVNIYLFVFFSHSFLYFFFTLCSEFLFSCLFEQDDTVGMIPINSKQRATLQLWNGISKKRDFSLFERVMKKHRKVNDHSPIYLQFRLKESKLGWSGPVCIASLGRFFLKFKSQQLDQVTALESNTTEFASVHLVEEGSTLGLYFHKPPNVSLPYRIENCLPDVSITYYQKVLQLLHFSYFSTIYRYKLLAFCKY